MATEAAFGGMSVVSESQLAGRGARLVAVLLDGVIAAIIAGIVFGLGGAGSAMTSSEEATNPTFLIIGGLLFLAYMIWQMWMLTTQGQTLGKKMMNLRVVKTDTSQNGGFMPNVLLRTIVGQWLLGAVPFYGLVDALFIFRDDRRTVHDLIAGTTVVKTTN